MRLSFKIEHLIVKFCPITLGRSARNMWKFILITLRRWTPDFSQKAILAFSQLRRPFCPGNRYGRLRLNNGAIQAGRESSKERGITMPITGMMSL